MKFSVARRTWEFEGAVVGPLGVLLLLFLLVLFWLVLLVRVDAWAFWDG